MSRNYFAMIEFMCRDALVLGRFWSELLEIPLEEGASSDYAQISPPMPRTKFLFVRSEPSGGSDRLVIAIATPDVAGDADRAVSLGATKSGELQVAEGTSWIELRDPENNRFTFNELPNP